MSVYSHRAVNGTSGRGFSVLDGNCQCWSTEGMGNCVRLHGDNFEE